jgi:hypothetical protein
MFSSRCLTLPVPGIGTTFLLTSIDLPIVSRVCVASVEKPYLAFFLKLGMGIVRDVLHTEEVRIPACRKFCERLRAAHASGKEDSNGASRSPPDLLPMPYTRILN